MPECKCDRCNQSYSIWFTDNNLWNKFINGYHFLCPTCFTIVAEKNGYKTTGWFITTEEQLQTTNKINILLQSGTCHSCGKNTYNMIHYCEDCE